MTNAGQNRIRSGRFPDSRTKKNPRCGNIRGKLKYEKTQALIRLGSTHFFSFTWDNHPKINLQHKTKETDKQFFVLISDTNIDVRDEIQFEKLVSENSFCHGVFDLEYKDILIILFHQIYFVKDF